MSALCHKRTFWLLDDLVGAGEQRGWDGESRSSGSIEIDEQLEFGRLLHRKIGRLGTFEYFPNINASIVSSGLEARCLVPE